jgi:hypothetical protein
MNIQRNAKKCTGQPGVILGFFINLTRKFVVFLFLFKEVCWENAGDHAQEAALPGARQLEQLAACCSDAA